MTEPRARSRPPHHDSDDSYSPGSPDGPEVGARPGRVARPLLAGAFTLFDLVLLAAALSTPTPVLWVALAVAVAAQLGFFAYAGAA